jgi:hypothetical protein
MAHNLRRLIVVTNGHCMHIPVTRVYHRHYPEVRGEGRSLHEASEDLSRLLARGLDRAHGPRREAMERALDDIRALRLADTRPSRPAMAAIS